MTRRFQFDIRSHVHRDAHDTEVVAATAQREKMPAACRLILNHLLLMYPKGWTDEEGQQHLKMHSYRRRRSDLKNRGLVEDSGERRMSAQGKPMIVWRWKDAAPQQ